MEPTSFKEFNRLLTKPDNMSDEECGSLPIFKDDRQCISCWKGSWKERLVFLFTGRVWLSVLGQNTQPPVWTAIYKPFKKEPGRIAKWLHELSFVW